MDIPCSSDYLEVKKRKHLPVFCPPPQSSAYTANKQYLALQTIPKVDEEGCLIDSDRFHVKLPYYDLALLKIVYRKK